ncbi:hypothetical protein DXT74_14940 [Chromobacterium sp. Rain0013]|nr:hypothetical protein DXT74_14940 [Chromobacterium sp. Rain0013]
MATWPEVSSATASKSPFGVHTTLMGPDLGGKLTEATGANNLPAANWPASKISKAGALWSFTTAAK